VYIAIKNKAQAKNKKRTLSGFQYVKLEGMVQCPLIFTSVEGGSFFKCLIECPLLFFLGIKECWHQ